MYKIPPLFGHIGRGVVRLSKSLTFWSIIIGLLLAVETALGIDVYHIFRDKGFFYTASTGDYKIALLLGAIIVFLLMVFYYIERDQNTKSQKDIDKMVEAINENTKELKKISLTIAQSIKQNSPTNPKRKSNNQPKNKLIITKETNNRTNKPQHEGENDNAPNK